MVSPTRAVIDAAVVVVTGAAVAFSLPRLPTSACGEELVAACPSFICIIFFHRHRIDFVVGDYSSTTATMRFFPFTVSNSRLQ